MAKQKKGTTVSERQAAEKGIEKKVAAPKEKTPKEKKPTIMKLVRTIFTENPAVDTQTVIKKVSEKFPASKINKSHVSFYRFTLRKEGIPIPARVKTEGKAAATKTEKASKTPKTGKKVLKDKMPSGQ